ncbi:hypothetical protein FQR65_LT15506 [Abscondita terminalis]|nr:hypothetical protein FQR65_LT15506 [Abscondita terminalis]
MFNNCFPNTLDTTVFPYQENGQNFTYKLPETLIAMWAFVTGSAQVWPYLKLMKNDKKLQELIRGLIRKQSKCINIDPYANAFYNDPTKRGEWFSDHTNMKPGIHERKWEIDSLCYPIRLSYHYWKISGDTTPFDDEWVQAQKNIYKTFTEQQRKNNLGPYNFMRTTPRGSDTLQVDGYGYPVKPVGLICSSFRPSDDSTVFSFLIPSNLFAVVSLRHSAEILKEVKEENELAQKFLTLADEVEKAVKEYGIIDHPKFGKLYAYEVDGFGSYLMMDDANVPSLLALPYLEAVDVNDEVYQRTEKIYSFSKQPSSSKHFTSGKETGCGFSRATQYFMAAKKEGYEITIASPNGGNVPIDPESLKPLTLDKVSKDYWNDASFRELLKNSKRLADVTDQEFEMVYLAGGHGTMYDFPMIRQYKLSSESSMKAVKW